MTPKNLKIIQIVLAIALILTIVMKMGFILNAIVAVALIAVSLYGAQKNKQ